MHIETFVTRQPCAPRENSCTFLGHGRTAHLCVRHNRFCYMTLTLVQKAEQAAFLSIPARSSRSKPEEPSVLIDWHCLTSHCSQTGARNDQNGARLFIAASDRHRPRLNASFLRFQCASMTGSVLSTIATLWLPCSPLYTDFLGLQTVCTKQSSKRIGRSLRSDSFLTIRLHCLFWRDPTSFDDCPSPTISKYAFAQL